jgi:transposase
MATTRERREIRARAMRMLARGKSPLQVAAKLGRCEVTIRRWRKAAEKPRRLEHWLNRERAEGESGGRS